MTDTLNQRFLAVAARRGDAPAFIVKRDGRWVSRSFLWAREQAQRTAFGLVALGYEPGARIAILAENRPEWATTDLGAMAAGLVPVPLYTTLHPSQAAYILSDAQAKLVFVSSMEHLRTVLEIRDRVPSLEKVVVFYPEDLSEDETVISLDTLQEMGDGRSLEEFEETALRVRPSDPATLIYTSGTTGNPKGVLLSHRNLVAEYEAVEPLFEGSDGDILMSFLPLSHVLQRVADGFCLQFGMTVAYAQSLDTLGSDLREVRPTHIVAVPRVYEKICGRIHDGVEKGSAVRRGLFKWAIAVGRSYRQTDAQGKIPPRLAIQHAIADRLVFGRIRSATGGRMKFYCSAGAPLAADLAHFFHAVGIRILEVYGMTELSGAVTANHSGEFRFGSVGKVCPGIEMKISDAGELLFRGDVVMQEYWRMPEATAETIDPDGWLHTGDVGHVDEDGFVHVTDRIKELIVTAGGKNVAPQPLENALKTDPLVSQVMVIGDQRNFISAVIVPQREALEAWAAEKGVDGGLATLCSDSRVIERYERIIAERMADFARYEQVRAFRLVPDEFSQEAGELTPTLKLKRRVLLAKYQEIIDGMYATSGRPPAP